MYFRFSQADNFIMRMVGHTLYLRPWWASVRYTAHIPSVPSVGRVFVFTVADCGGSLVGNVAYCS